MRAWHLEPLIRSPLPALVLASLACGPTNPAAVPPGHPTPVVEPAADGESGAGADAADAQITAAAAEAGPAEPIPAEPDGAGERVSELAPADEPLAPPPVAVGIGGTAPPPGLPPGLRDSAMAFPRPAEPRATTVRRGISFDEGAGLDREVILGPLRSRQEAMTECYHEALRDDPALEGHMTVLLTIETDDDVVATVESADQPLVEAGVGECVCRVLGRIRVSDGTGEAGPYRVRIPLVFLAPEPPPEEDSDGGDGGE